VEAHSLEQRVAAALVPVNGLLRHVGSLVQRLPHPVLLLAAVELHAEPMSAATLCHGKSVQLAIRSSKERIGPIRLFAFQVAAVTTIEDDELPAPVAYIQA
jgi:hypothetical protein